MYEGVNASDGIGIGVARVAVEPDLSFTPHAPEDAGDEKQRYSAAVAKFIEQTNAQIARMTETVGEEAAAIMGAHIEFAEDEGIVEMVNSSIEAGMCAEQAVSEAYDMYYNMFSNMEDELFRERAADVADITKTIKSGDMVIVDGSRGRVLVNPADNDLTHYRTKAKQYAEEKLALEAYRGKETVTGDGEKVLLVANIGNPDDANVAAEHDCEGVGLLRSEFLFMDAKELPSEDEQFAAYQKVALRMKNQPVIIRTLDVGGDKEIPYLNLRKEENPFMGYRAVRYCLNNPDQYKVQLTALLRASAFGDIKIMVPLVTSIDEIRQVKALVEECKADLDARGVAYNKDIEVGTMIETPAASLIADDLAAECDFFSIGTNDLIGYTMCADRGNDRVGYLYDVYQPAVLRSLKRIIEEGNKAGIMVGMCGEAAADPLLIPVLISFGLNEFSVSAPSILRTRRIISEWTKAEADALTEKVMKLKTATEVKAMLQAAAR